MLIENTIKDLVSGKKVALPWDPANWNDNQLTGFVEFGTPTFNIHDLDRDKMCKRFDEIRSWMQHVSGNRFNAVYLDTTTLHTAKTLIFSGEDDAPVIPPALIDLSNFVNSVVLFDHIFYLENSEINPYELNEALGEPVIISLPVESFGFSNDGDPLNSVGGLLRGLWYDTDQYMQMLLDRTYKLFQEDAEAIKTAWRSIIDFKENEELWFDPLHKIKSESYSTDGPQLLEHLTEIHNQLFYEALYHRKASIGPAELSEFVHRIIDECNYRSLFNTAVSNALQLYYMPNSFRLPFRNFLYRRARTIQQYLPTIHFIEHEYRHLAELYSDTDQNELRLPLFLGAVLNQISRLDEFFNVLADMRRKAESFRDHRAELDDALERQSLREIKRLRSALQEDGDILRLKFPLAPIAGGVAAILAACTGQMTYAFLASVGILTAGSQFSPYYERLKNRVLRPGFRFLTDMKDVADGLTLSYPLIRKLWHLDDFPADFFEEVFKRRFRNLRALSY
jgi:hypothetical protein